MKKKTVIIATSDIHVGQTEIEDVVEMTLEIKKVVEEEELHVLALLVLGDLGESMKDIEKTLLALRVLAPVRVYVPGNHDLFDMERMGSSRRRYDELLPALAKRCEYVWGVSAQPLLLGDVAVVTTTAWPRPETSIAEVDLDPKQVMDAREELPDCKWITRDLRYDVVSNEQLQIFLQALAAVPKDDRKVIVATHYPIMIEQLQRDVDAYTPWFLSPRFGDALRTWSEARPELVVEVISGHLHEQADVVVNGLRLRVIDSGYRRPSYAVVEV
jgi:predicted phosphohydrolase